MALDLPTLERPTNAISALPSEGNSRAAPADARKAACANSRFDWECGIGRVDRRHTAGQTKNSNRITRFDRYPRGDKKMKRALALAAVAALLPCLATAQAPAKPDSAKGQQ